MLLKHAWVLHVDWVDMLALANVVVLGLLGCKLLLLHLVIVGRVGARIFVNLMLVHIVAAFWLTF